MYDESHVILNIFILYDEQTDYVQYKRLRCRQDVDTHENMVSEYAYM